MRLVSFLLLLPHIIHLLIICICVHLFDHVIISQIIVILHIFLFIEYLFGLLFTLVKAYVSFKTPFIHNIECETWLYSFLSVHNSFLYVLWYFLTLSFITVSWMSMLNLPDFSQELWRPCLTHFLTQILNIVQKYIRLPICVVEEISLVNFML